MEMDVRDENQINEMINSIIKAFGKIDVIINNSGIVKYINAKDMIIKNWLKFMEQDI